MFFIRESFDKFLQKENEVLYLNESRQILYAAPDNMEIAENRLFFSKKIVMIP
jgi:hypothetical protein